MSTPKSPPPRIDGYSYVEGIGGGGFADVFLFTQHSTGRAVAVKVLRAEHLGDASLTQFETEARVMAGVSTHPYIVTIHDAGIATDGRPFLVMEHYPQPHFGRRASGGHLPVSEVLRVGVQVASAVETAHRAGIIHRDIKPANILTSTYGDPGLTDFGLAGVQTDEGMSAAAGVSYGFSAPEVVLDETATGSVSSDVYALGATVYALLTGRSPVYVPGGDNSSATLARRVAGGGIQPVRRDDLPRSLEHLLATTLSTRPTDRPASAADLATALRSIEQELRLPLTPLVVTGTTGPAPTAPRAGGEDGTRRKPRVVDMDGGRALPKPPPAPTGHASAATPSGPSFATPPPVAAPFSSTGSPAGALPDEDPTVARPRPGTASPALLSPTAITGEDDGCPVEPDPPSDNTRKYLAIGGIAAAVLLVVVLAIVFSGGGSTSDDASSTPTRPSTIPSTSAGPSGLYVGSPVGVTMTPNPDGSITVAWSPPEGHPTPEAIEYQVFRDDQPDLPVLATVQALSAQIGPGLEPNESGKVCVKVQARLGDDVADSDQACALVQTTTTDPNDPSATDTEPSTG